MNQDVWTNSLIYRLQKSFNEWFQVKYGRAYSPWNNNDVNLWMSFYNGKKFCH